MIDKRQAPAPPATATTTTGYPLLGGRGSRAERWAYLGALVLGIALVYLYRLYTQTSDVAPDSFWGYVFAISGTMLLLLVGVGYTLRKRSLRHAKVRLHTMLAWHVVGGLLGTALIFMHTAGNFNPRSGTYALYGLIAATLSGVIGRLFDRVCPRLAAAAAAQALTEDGEDRIVALQQKLSDAQAHQAARRVPHRPPVGAPWDLAYYDLDPEAGTIPALLEQANSAPYLGQDGQPVHTMSAMGSATIRLLRDPQRLRSRVLRQATAVGDAASREQIFIGMVRAWRRLHVLLCVVALGLLIWHISYAVMLLINAR